MKIQNLPLLAIFAEVCHRGSITAAATSLSLSKSVVSTHLKTLEDELGTRLLNRTTRQLSLTGPGSGVLYLAEQILAAAAEVAAVAESQRDEATGTLRIAATLDLGARFVAPVIAALVRAHPGLRAELVLDDERLDPIASRLDALVRIGAPADASLTVKRLATDREILVASPALRTTWKKARAPQDLVGAPWVVKAALASPTKQRFTHKSGKTQETKLADVRVAANTTDALRALVAAGAGFAVIPRHKVADDLRAGRLVHVLPQWSGRAVRLDLLLPSRQHQPRRLVLFIEALRAYLAKAGLK